MNIVAQAERIARKAHAGQVDKQGVDYILHPERVAAAVETDEQKAIAWLHDVLEDTPVSFYHLVATERMPIAVASSVWMLSRKSSEDYTEFIDRIAKKGNVNEITVKLADLKDNLRPGGSPTLYERYKVAIALLEQTLYDLNGART